MTADDEENVPQRGSIQFVNLFTRNGDRFMREMQNLNELTMQLISLVHAS